jgi:imidazolonepropionase-like amidohydrolase
MISLPKKNGALQLVNCRIVDVLDGTVREGNVSIHGGKITSTTEDGNFEDNTVDLQGAYLSPGLISCHTHLSLTFPFHERDENESAGITSLRCLRRGHDALRAGITTVRTVAELHRADLSLRNMIQKGCVVGPRIFSAGCSVTVTGGHGHGFGAQVADGEDEFLKKARAELEAGANHVKIFITGGIAKPDESFDEPQMTFEEMRGAVQAASSRGTYVCAHAGGPVAIQTAIRAGVRCFEHGYYLDKETVAVMKEAGSFLVPTLLVSRSPDWMRANGFQEWTIEKAGEAGEDHLDSIKLAISAGIPIVNGTDAPPGDIDRGVPLVVREAEYYQEAGLSPLDTLRSLTSNAAQLLNASNSIGTIQEGLEADLIATHNNPLKDIQALRSIPFIMKAGQILHTELE